MIYASERVKCPYYRKNDSNRIVCEGFKKKTYINITFEDTKKLKEYKEQYCNDIQNYNDCMICAMLNKKYGI